MKKVRIVNDKDGKWFHITVDGVTLLNEKDKPAEYGSWYDATQAANIIRSQLAKEFYNVGNPAP